MKNLRNIFSLSLATSLTVLGVHCVFATELIVGETAGETGAYKVFLTATEKPGYYADFIADEFTEVLPNLTNRETAHGGLLTVGQYREQTEPTGLRHVHYQQRYQPPKDWIDFADAVPPAGFPLNGGYVSYHYTQTDVLYLVTGTYYENIKLVEEPNIKSAKTALLYAFDAAQEITGLRRYDELSPEVLEDLITRAKLVLHPTKEEGVFGFAWHLNVATQGKGTPSVVIDAVDGSLLAYSKPMKWSCDPETDNLESVILKPQNIAIAEMDIDSLSTFASSPPAPEHYDAHVPQTPTTPSIQILRGVEISRCTGWEKYQPAHTLLKDGVNRYDNVVKTLDYNQGYICFPGRAIGDAIRHAKTTFDVFWNTLEYQGISGSGDQVQLVVDARCDDGFSGGAFYSHEGELAVPAGSVAFCGRRSDPDLSPTNESTVCNWYRDNRIFSAALDVVAHEISHGVIHSTAGWHGYSPREMELHEGFADIMGYGVEWMAPVQNSIEVPDWTSGEDLGYIYRRVDLDDGVGGLRFFNLDPHDTTDQNARGNPLPVAFRILTEGGPNPACGRSQSPPSAWICENNLGGQGLGIELAFNIYFRMLRYHTQASTDWAAFPNLIVSAAGEVNDHSVQSSPIIATADEFERPCIDNTITQYKAWSSFAAVGWKGNLRFCNIPS